MNPGQSLGDGAAGVALLHLETGDWAAAFDALAGATAGGLSVAPGASLFYGAPALAFVLAGTQDPRLTPARTTCAEATLAVTHRRLEAAHTRIDQRRHLHHCEYDLIRGLTGLGVALRHLGDHDALRPVLEYLVRLTEPLGDYPGWWCWNAPEHGQSPDGGHANHGMAHGITGPLAFLALTYRDGVIIDGHAGAITRICQWLDTWQQDTGQQDRGQQDTGRQDSGAMVWWPQTITCAELAEGRTAQQTPLRPSWCYGTPGIARAQQLAALALGDPHRRRLAEAALLRCVTDAGQLALLTDAGLCHGAAGLYQTAWRTAQDAATPTLDAHLTRLADLLAGFPPAREPGLLTGEAGRALVTRTARRQPPATKWDSCLLLH